MFTIKYRSYRLSEKQPGPDVVAPRAYYDEVDLIDGPFALVSKEENDGWTVVYAHRGDDMLSTTFGPCKDDEAGRPRPVVWVMNEQGATVATYRL